MEMKFFKREEGSIAIATALLLVVLLGFAALAIDVGIWYQSQRKLQIAADTGAIAGALALSSKGASTLTNEVTNDLILNECTATNKCNIVAINNPPLSGPNTSNETAVEVILTQPGARFLSFNQLSSDPTLHARSVAGLKPNNLCMTILGTSGTVLKVGGGGIIAASNCGIYVNSSDSSAVSVAGTSSITTLSLKVVGNVINKGGGIINSTLGIITSAPPAVDPYRGLNIPSYGACTQNNYKLTGGTKTISPGTYCGGITLTSTSILTMNPGIYILNKGDFSIGAQATVTGTGVTIILTSSTGSNFGSVNISSGASVNLSAPTNGATAGILFYEDRNAPSSITSTFQGGSTMNLNGALYFPSSSLKYAGNSTSTAGTCLSIIANNVTLTGAAGLGVSGCVVPPPGGTPLLFE
jgi:hypothetical protein